MVYSFYPGESTFSDCYVTPPHLWAWRTRESDVSLLDWAKTRTDVRGFTVPIYCFERVRAAARNKYPKIAPDFGPDSRRGKGRIAGLCNPCRNTEAGPKDKQDGIVIFFAALSACNPLRWMYWITVCSSKPTVLTRLSCRRHIARKPFTPTKIILTATRLSNRPISFSNAWTPRRPR